MVHQLNNFNSPQLNNFNSAQLNNFNSAQLNNFNSLSWIISNQLSCITAIQLSCITAIQLSWITSIQLSWTIWISIQLNNFNSAPHKLVKMTTHPKTYQVSYTKSALQHACSSRRKSSFTYLFSLNWWWNAIFHLFWGTAREIFLKDNEKKIFRWRKSWKTNYWDVNLLFCC